MQSPHILAAAIGVVSALTTSQEYAKAVLPALRMVVLVVFLGLMGYSFFNIDRFSRKMKSSASSAEKAFAFWRMLSAAGRFFAAGGGLLLLLWIVESLAIGALS